MHPGHPERLALASYVGQLRYSLTFCTHERRKSFADAAAVDLVWRQILRSANQTHFAIPAYCFMPDHLHLLAEGLSDAADLRRFLTKARQYSGYYDSRQFGDRLWQRYGFERILRDGEPSQVVARYILNNPLRAGLVTMVQEYPFVGSGVYTLEELIEWIR
jgi:putative transposase